MVRSGNQPVQQIEVKIALKQEKEKNFRASFSNIFESELPKQRLYTK